MQTFHVRFFWPCYVILDEEGDKKSQKIISELENIDDECEEKDISFVKTSDEGIEKEYDLPSLPTLVFYRNRFRQIYTGTYRAVSRIFVLIDAKYVGIYYLHFVCPCIIL
jgi:hypothetical protein